MKLFTTTALATLLTATTVVADNHGADASGKSAGGSMDNSKTEASKSNDTNADMGTDTRAGASEMYDEGKPDAGSKDDNNLIRARDITGGPIYTMSMTSDDDWSMTMADEEIDSSWQEIGEIEDLVLSRTGQLTGVVAEVGGFLDIADKHVLLPINDVKLIPSDDRSYAIVTRFNEEQLEELENIDETAWY